MTFRLRSRKAILAAVTAAVALLITMAPPAWAHGEGDTTNGASNISENATPTFPLCLEFNDTLVIELWNVGGFNDSAGPYETLATFTSNQVFWFSPAGIFDNSLCVGEPADVVGTLTVSGDVTCTEADATYSRTTSAYVIETTEETDCTITGSTDPAHSDDLEFTGVQQACTGEAPDPCDPEDTPDEDSDDVEFVGIYEQN